jgi:hypothetical protein
MKTENKLNHILHLLLCLFTFGFWVPVYLFRLLGNEMHNRLIRQYNAGHRDGQGVQYLDAYSQARTERDAAKEGCTPPDAVGMLLMQTELRELQGRLSRCEFDKSLYSLRLEQLCRALATMPFTAVPATVREAFELGRKLTAGTTLTDYQRATMHADNLEQDLGRIMTALDHMTDPAGIIQGYAGPELDVLQVAYDLAKASTYRVAS